MGALSSTWDAPTPAQEAYLQAAEAQLEEALMELNRVFAVDVAGFRQQVEEAGFEFLEPKESLEVPSAGS
jgi:hypothetical protein